jgi:hypothetical protein
MPGLVETFGGAEARASMRPELGPRVRVDARSGRVRVASGSTARHDDEYADTDVATTREEPKKKRRGR